MRLLALLLLGSAVSLKLPVPVSTPARRCSSTAAKQLKAGSGGRVPDGGSNEDKTAKGGFVRPKVGSSVQTRNDSTNNAAKNMMSVTEVVVATLANTATANTLLTPLHKWVVSRQRVAQAVEEAAAGNQSRSPPATAADRERQLQQRALFEEQQRQEEQQLNPWIELLRDTVPLPQPVKNVYNALVYVTTVPERLTESGKQTAESLSAAAESLSAAAEIVAAAPDRVRKTVTQTQETVKTAQEVLAAAPDRVQEVVTATQELPRRVERAVEEGTEAVEAALEESKRLAQAGRQMSEAAETLPSRLPELIETATDDALSLASGVAEGTAAGVDAAGTALWGVAKEAGVWAIERVLRQALAPVHEYRTSAKRVQAAVDEDRMVLPPTRPRPRSSEEAATDSAFLMTAGTAVPSLARDKATRKGTTPGNSEGVADGATSDNNSDSLPVSRLVGLRGRFSSWRRKRRSIVSVVIPDAADDDDADKANDVDKTSSSVASSPSSSSKSAVAPQEARSGTSLAAAPAGLGITVGRSDDAAIQRQGDGAVGSLVTPTPTTASVTAGDGQVTDGEDPLAEALADSVTAVGIKASLKETDSLALPEALASVSAAVENRELSQLPVVRGAPAPIVSRLPAVAGPEVEETESGIDSEKDLATKVRDTLSQAGVDEVLGGKGRTQPGESSRTQSPEPAVAPSNDVVSAATPLGGLDDDTPKDNERPPSMADSTGRVAAALGAAAAAAEPASERASAVATASVSDTAVAGTSAGAALDPPTAPTATEPAAVVEQQGAAATAPTQRDGGSGGLGSTVPRVGPSSSVVPSGVALPSAKPPSPIDTAREKGDHSSSNLPTQREKSKEIAINEARDDEETAATGSIASAGKPPAIPPAAKNDSLVTAAAGAAAATVAGKSHQVSVGKASDRDGPKGSSNAWGATNPAAAFLKDWVEKAVPQKKAELKRMEDAVCWERQWYPVAMVSELPQQRRRLVGDGVSISFQMLGREYELLPVPPGRPAGQATSLESAWVCQAVGDPDDSSREQGRGSAGPIARVDVPVRESSGLVWAWPDTSPEGLATAALTNPVPIPGFSVAGGNWGGGVEPWRRLLRRQPASQRRWAVGGGGDRENGSGGREQGGSRRNDVIIEREISCGYAGAVGGLLAASHGEAVRAVAAGGNGNGKGLEEKDLQIATTSLASATGSSSGLFQAAFDTCGVEGQALFSSPIVVEWRFSFPAPLPMADETAAGGALSGARGEKTTPTANRQGAAAFSPAPASERLTALTRDGVVIATPPRRGWLRRRLSAIGGGGDVGGRADNDNGGVVERRSRVAVDGLGTEGDRRGNRLPADRGVHYVAVVLPVAPKRTKIFARLAVEPSGLLDGRSLWWSRRIRRGLLAEIIDGAALAEAGGQAKSAGQGASGDGDQSGLLSSAVGEWLEGTANGGPF